LKNAGDANRDYRHTFMKQFTFCKFVNPLLGFSNKYIENDLSAVNLSWTESFNLGFSLSALTFIIVFLTTTFLFFFAIMPPMSTSPQLFPVFVASKSL
jgi:hypothetical protein